MIGERPHASQPTPRLGWLVRSACLPRPWRPRPGRNYETTGGAFNLANDLYTSISGGGGVASGPDASIVGGRTGKAKYFASTVLGLLGGVLGLIRARCLEEPMVVGAGPPCPAPRAWCAIRSRSPASVELGGRLARSRRAVRLGRGRS